MFQEEIITATHDAGFFSVCNINLLTVMDYFNRCSRFCKLDTSNQWSLYKDEPGDVYNQFFNYNPNPIDIEPQSYITGDTEIQFCNYKLINYNFVNPFIYKYFSFSDKVLEIKKQLLHKYDISPTNTISIFYRGGDKYKETNLPSYEDMESKLKEITNLFPNNKIIAQSDEIEFCNYIKSQYNDVIVFDECKKISKDMRSAIQYHTGQGERVINTQTFLAIMSIISETQHIILNSGSISMFICFFRGNADNIYQYYCPLHTNDIFWY